MSRYRPDIVIADSFGFIGAAIRLAGYRGALWGVEHGGVIQRCKTRTGRTRVRVERLIAAATFTGEIFVSNFVHRIVEPMPQARRSVHIPNPVPAPDAAAALPMGALTLGFAGRLVEGKGIDRAIDLISDLRTTIPNARLLIAGDGPKRPQFEEYAASLDLSRAIEFCGWVNDIPGFWERCHAAVALNDSLEESFCVSVAEALACGRPAVVSDFGAQAELVNPGVSGFIVPAGDRAATVRAARELLDANVVSRLSVEARASASRFHPGLVAKELVNLATGDNARPDS
jgi:glycosyltransferase involved in cell wall biosynthesis